MVINKDARIAIALSKEQKDSWQAYADELGIPLSVFIRKCVEAYIQMARRKKVEKGE